MLFFIRKKAFYLWWRQLSSRRLFGNGSGGLAYQFGKLPFSLPQVEFGAGNADRSQYLCERVEKRRGQAEYTRFVFAVVNGITLLTDVKQFFRQPRNVR